MRVPSIKQKGNGMRKMSRRCLSTTEKKSVLNRDGWCCNTCGYVPFHTFADVPKWAKNSYQAFCSYANDLRSSPPVIFVEWEFTEDDIDMKFSYLHGGELEFDHINPVCKGGLLELDNVQALCHDCHRIKSNIDYRLRRSDLQGRGEI